MKSVKVTFFVLLFICTLTACFHPGQSNRSLFSDNVSIADASVDEFVGAIRSNDSQAITSMFSPNVQEKCNDLDVNSLRLVEVISELITEHSTTKENGVGAEVKQAGGKRTKVLDYAFNIQTNDALYYIWVRECVVDELDANNIGLLTLHIISSENWPYDYVFRGNGTQTPGVVFVE